MSFVYVNKEQPAYDLNNTAEAAKVFKALSSEVRLEILKCLVEKAMTITELSEHFYLPVSSMCLHIKTLKDAGLISVTPRPGVRGTTKLCGIRVSTVTLQLFAHLNAHSTTVPFIYEMPVGNYSDCDVESPCGLAIKNEYVSLEDSPYGFYLPEHVSADILWFSKGHVSYDFPNQSLKRGSVRELCFSFEMCSEAPGYNEDWPSDVDILLNDKLITTLRLKGDHGGRRGKLTPEWWSPASTQYGDLYELSFTESGTYLNHKHISDYSLKDLDIQNRYSFRLTFLIDEHREHIGGLNLFGKNFGDYEQSIRMSVTYQ